MSSLFRSKLILLGLLALPISFSPAAFAHGSMGVVGADLEAGEFDFSPIITVEGHGGFDKNLEDGLGLRPGWFVRWCVQLGLGQRSHPFHRSGCRSSLVWGEAEHFYGKFATDDHDDDHGHDDHDDMLITTMMTRTMMTRTMMMIMVPMKRIMMMTTMIMAMTTTITMITATPMTPLQADRCSGFVQVRYAPNDRLNVALSWNPYYVTQDQDDDIKGLKNELGTKVTWALGDGDVDFALGDGLGDVIDGVFLSVDHRQG